MRVSLPDPRELHRMVSRRFRAVGNSTGWFRAGFAQLGTPQDGFAQVSRSWELHRMVSRRFRAVGNSTGWFRAGFAQLGTPQDGFAQVSRSWELHRMVSRSLGAVEVIFLNYNIFMACFF